MKNEHTKPNILLFFTDQQRADTCGCYGQRLKVTPNLDRMAANGVRFERAMSMQPVCGPARSALMTGLYPTATGCFRNQIGLPPGCTTVADLFHRSGYETSYIGKWHLASSGASGDPARPDLDLEKKAVPPEYRGGFKDYWLASDVLEFTSTGYTGHMFDGSGNKREFSEGRYRADAQTDWVLEYLENRPTEKPFFLVSSYIEPHHQNSSGHYEGPEGSRALWKDFTPPGDLAEAGGNWREEYPDYLGCCHALDNGLGRVLKKLEDLGIRENTLVFYFADHGSHFQTRNTEYKRSCHDASLHIPMVISGPGFEGGKSIEPCVSLMDIPLTILSAAGIRPLEGMQGHDLHTLVEGTTEWPEEVFYQISESHVGRGIRTLKWKYAVTAPGKRGWKDADADLYVESFLYDLEQDPYELTNRVCDPALAGTRAWLASRLIARMNEAGELTPQIIPHQD